MTDSPRQNRVNPFVYGAPRASVREEVAVLTPSSTTKAIAAGFEPYFGAYR